MLWLLASACTAHERLGLRDGRQSYSTSVENHSIDIRISVLVCGVRRARRRAMDTYSGKCSGIFSTVPAPRGIDLSIAGDQAIDPGSGERSATQIEGGAFTLTVLIQRPEVGTREIEGGAGITAHFLEAMLLWELLIRPC
jgi:hypothetical protein